MDTKKKRQSNIELIRIVAMLMIISSHFSLHGIINNGLLPSGSLFNKILSTTMVLGNVGVGLFFAITGYFSNEKNSGKINIKIISDLFFYSILNALILLVLYKNSILNVDFGIDDTRDLIKSVMRFLITPVTGENWWFITAYIYLIVFLSPVLNRIEKRLNMKGRIILIIVLLFLSVVSEYLGTPVMRLLQASAYFMIGKVIRVLKDYKKSRKNTLYFWGLLFLHSMLMFVNYSNNSSMIYLISNLLATVIIIPLFVIIIFCIFLNLKINDSKYKEFIDLLAETTLGIYLLHDSVYVRHLLWKYIVPMEKIWNSTIFIIYAAVIIGGIFLIGSIFNLLYIFYLRPGIVRCITSGKKSILSLIGAEE